MMTSINTQCPDKYSLFQYFNGDFPVQDVPSIEDHLGKCDACLLKIQEFALIQSRLDAAPDLDVPQEFIEKTEEIWKKAETDQIVESPGDISRLVVQLVKSGFQVLKESILPDATEINWRPLLEPAHVFRESGAGKGSLELLLEQEIRKQNILLSLSLTREAHKSVRLRVNLKESGKSLPQIRVSLKRNGSMLHSKKSDSDGMVTFSELCPGSYTIQVPARKIEWTIDIRR
jgi:hypothetical protein